MTISKPVERFLQTSLITSPTAVSDKIRIGTAHTLEDGTSGALSILEIDVIRAAIQELGYTEKRFEQIYNDGSPIENGSGNTRIGFDAPDAKVNPIGEVFARVSALEHNIIQDFRSRNPGLKYAAVRGLAL